MAAQPGGPTKRKIVVVDDSRVVLALVQEALEDRFIVIAVDNPFGFSSLLWRERPALALVDVFMPALLGDKLVEIAVKQGGASCPIVLFSDRPENELAHRAAACGAAGYIRKTADPHLLIKEIERFLKK